MIEPRREPTRTSAATITLADLAPSPTNVRSRLTDIDDLAASIKEHGILQPLLVVPLSSGRFKIIAGHRRRAAAQRLGLKSVPCVVRSNNRSDETALMLVENLQRADLDPIDAANALARLRESHTLPEVARITGLSAATIRARLCLLDLPAEAQSMVSNRTLSLGDAVGLARQVRSTGSGSKRVGSGPKRTVCAFGSTHRLAGYVRARCTHADSARRMLGPGCAECWEATIRDDVLGNLANVTPVGSLDKSTTAHTFDEAVVQRVLAGDLGGLTLSVGDREEAVRRLNARGMSDRQIAAQIKTTGKTVERIRKRLSIAPATPPSRLDQRALHRAGRLTGVASRMLRI